MSLEAIEQKAKAVLEACYELERLKMKKASKAEVDKQESFIISLADGMKSDAQAEKV